MWVRLFNSSTLQLAYALAKVQDVLWTKKGSWDKMNRGNIFDGGVLQKRMVRSC